MKTNFHKSYRRINRDKERRLTYIFGAFIFMALVVTLFKSPILGLVSPLWQGQNFLARSFKELSLMIKDKNALVEENILLKEKLVLLDSLESSVRNYEDTQTEMLELFGRNGVGDFIAATVIARPPKTLYDILVLDAGEVNGIRDGARVSDPVLGELGTVVEVSQFNSKVSLYSTSGRETSAFLDRDDEPVTLIGRGGGTFFFTVPKDVLVMPGDRILLGSIDAPLVAVVEASFIEPTDSLKKVLARSVVNMHKIRFVEVR
ncbi:MAG TPA: rod shape-determining protein MreC [Parcubacteria group bacterium]|nr:rod shape-determining protein MreC [Parcubacteria group bacterium]